MQQGGRSRRALGSWLFVCAFFALCGILAMLQFRSLAEVSIAARERLHSSLQASLAAVSQDFNSEISAAAGALMPSSPRDAGAAQESFTALYDAWKKSARHHRMFARMAMAVPQKRAIELLVFDQEAGVWKPAEWPSEWIELRSRFEFPPSRQGPGRSQPGLPGMGPEAGMRSGGPAFEAPIFGSSGLTPGGRGRGPGAPMSRREVAWLIFEVNLAYVGESLLPEILSRHLGADYQVEVVTRTVPQAVVYRSDPDLSPDLTESADASVSLFDPQMDQILRRGSPGFGRGPGGGPGAGGPAGPGPGRWLIFVRHRAGSLEAAVSQARWRSTAVNAGVLLLMVATLAAFLRYTRRAQKLAELQMDFVAGVSHELRTPLTVIHTAAYNLRGKLAANPAQVERYGALIQQESGRLKDLVEQVLRFAGANAGHVIQEREPLAVDALIGETLNAAKGLLESAHCVVEKRVDADLPPVLGDPLALRQAIQNLLANAAKYGAGEGRWIGISASKAGGAPRGAGQPAVEIRVTDRGTGIPAEEQGHIFDPFFRGSRAVQDQVHGTGLGLSLVKKIVEAHGGSIKVRSEPMKGAEFIITLPAVDASAHSPAEPPGAAG